jgi:hypothetical protein
MTAQTPGNVATPLEPGGDYIVSINKTDAPDYQTAEDLVDGLVYGGVNAEPGVNNTTSSPYATANVVGHNDGGDVWQIEIIVAAAPSNNPPEIGGPTSSFPGILYDVVAVQPKPSPSPYPSPSPSSGGGFMGWVKAHPFLSAGIALGGLVLLGAGRSKS